MKDLYDLITGQEDIELYCPNCGAEVEDTSDQYCEACGILILEEEWQTKN